ncbi:MAG: 6,7-dimethyl-8-ribityllumazine synthase [Gammaproteobacteria bacterium]
MSTAQQGPGGLPPEHWVRRWQQMSLSQQDGKPLEQLDIAVVASSWNGPLVAQTLRRVVGKLLDVEECAWQLHGPGAIAARGREHVKNTLPQYLNDQRQRLQNCCQQLETDPASRPFLESSIGGSFVPPHVDIASLLDHGHSDLLTMTPLRIRLRLVPGALELPWAAQQTLAMMGEDMPRRAVIALGAVIRGETVHFDLVSQQSCAALSQVALKTRCPVINGILTLESESQAPDRIARAASWADACLDMLIPQWF